MSRVEVNTSKKEILKPQPLNLLDRYPLSKLMPIQPCLTGFLFPQKASFDMVLLHSTRKDSERKQGEASHDDFENQLEKLPTACISGFDIALGHERASAFNWYQVWLDLIHQEVSKEKITMGSKGALDREGQDRTKRSYRHSYLERKEDHL
jgi:hypothetical protein